MPRGPSLPAYHARMAAPSRPPIWTALPWVVVRVSQGVMRLGVGMCPPSYRWPESRATLGAGLLYVGSGQAYRAEHRSGGRALDLVHPQHVRELVHLVPGQSLLVLVLEDVDALAHEQVHVDRVEAGPVVELLLGREHLDARGVRADRKRALLLDEPFCARDGEAGGVELGHLLLVRADAVALHPHARRPRAHAHHVPGVAVHPLLLEGLLLPVGTYRVALRQRVFARAF